jgi:hypothetical protein
MSLTNLYIAHVGVKQLAEERARAAQAAAEQAQQAAAAKLLRAYLAKWEPLRPLLGLKGAPTLQGGEVVIFGQSSINDLPVDTMASVGLPRDDAHRPNLVITIRSRLLEGVFNRMEITSNLEATDYPERLGLLCTIWMAHYGRAMAEQQTADHEQCRTVD